VVAPESEVAQDQVIAVEVVWVPGGHDV
jgi:hypothetical protein